MNAGPDRAAGAGPEPPGIGPAARKAGFEAKGKINRKDFGVEWNAVLEAGGVAVGEKVTIGLEISAIRS